MRYIELQLALPILPAYTPATDTPEARAIRRRAWLDRDAGLDMGDWSKEDRDALQDDPQTLFDVMRVYRIARHPSRIAAPVSWPVEIALLATGTLLMVGDDQRFTLRAIPRSVWRYPLWKLHRKTREAAGRRRARQLGLTPATTPEPRLSGTLWHLPVLLSFGLWLGWRHRGEDPRSLWEVWLATQIVRAISERRGFNAALRRP